MQFPVKIGFIIGVTVSTLALGLAGAGLASTWNQTSLLSTSQETLPLVPAANEANEMSLEEYAAAYALAPTADSAAPYAHALMTQEQWSDAEKVLDSVEENQKLLYEKALFDVMQNHLEEAKKAFKAAGSENFLLTYENFEAAQGAETIYLQALLCKTLIDSKEFELAAILAKTVLTQKNDYRDVWMLLGYAKYTLENYKDAEDAFRQAKKIDSTKPEVHYFLGSTLMKTNKVEEAIDELELALLYGFEPAEEAYKKVAESYEFLEQWTDAVGAYEALLNLNPSSPNSFQKPIELCLKQLKDTVRALSLAQKAIVFFPGEALSHTLLAKVYLADAKIDLASQSIEAAFQMNSNLPLAHYLAGEIREAQNNVEGARWEFKKTFELTEENDPLHAAAAEKYNLLTAPLNSSR